MPSLRATIITRFGLAAALLLPAACDSERLVSPRDISRHFAAESRWRSRSFTDYSYEIRTACFCPPEVNRWTRVTVRNGTVVAAEAVEPDPGFPITSISLWVPIDSIFANLRRTLESGFQGSESHLDAIVATYDPSLGYPTFIEYRAKPNIADGGMTKHLRNVTPLDEVDGAALNR